MKKLIAEILIYILGAGCAITAPPTDHSEWVDIEFQDGTPSIQGEVSYRWEQDGLEHIVLTSGEEYAISIEEIDFH